MLEKQLLNSEFHRVEELSALTREESPKIFAARNNHRPRAGIKKLPLPRISKKHLIVLQLIMLWMFITSSISAVFIFGIHIGKTGIVRNLAHTRALDAEELQHVAQIPLWNVVFARALAPASAAAANIEHNAEMQELRESIREELLAPEAGEEQALIAPPPPPPIVEQTVEEEKAKPAIAKAPVKVDAVVAPTPTTKIKREILRQTPLQKGAWYIEFARGKSTAEAKLLKQNLQERGFSVTLQRAHGGASRRYRILLGPFDSEPLAIAKNETVGGQIIAPHR